MIERIFDLETSPDVKRYYLRCNYNDIAHVVTMADVENAFKHDETELLRIKNNTSNVWFLEEIFD